MPQIDYYNLLLIKYLNKNFGMVSTFTVERCFVYKCYHLVASGIGTMDSLCSLYIIDEMALIHAQSTSNELLQKRLGHLSEGGMIKLNDCIPCIKGKMHSESFQRVKQNALKIFWALYTVTYVNQ